MQVSNDNTDQPISNADLHDTLVDEREDIEESQTLPKWLVHTLRDRKLDAPLSSRTRLSSHSASYVSNCYPFAISSLCDEFEPIPFDEAQNSKIRWLLCNQNMMLLCRMVHGLYKTFLLDGKVAIVALNGCIS